MFFFHFEWKVSDDFFCKFSPASAADTSSFQDDENAHQIIIIHRSVSKISSFQDDVNAHQIIHRSVSQISVGGGNLPNILQRLITLLTIQCWDKFSGEIFFFRHSGEKKIQTLWL